MMWIDINEDESMSTTLLQAGGNWLRCKARFVSRALSGALLLCCMVWLLGPSAALAESRVLDRIIAVVDDDVILASELVTRINTVRQQIDRSNGEQPPEEVLVNQILERLILESVQLQEAARRGIEIDDETLTQAVLNFAERNGVTLEVFQQKLAEDGVAYGEFREQIRREMVVNRVQRALVNRRVQISEQDINALVNSPFFEALLADQFQLGHILLEIDEQAGDEVRAAARAKAEEIVAELRSGGEFRALARANSALPCALEGCVSEWSQAAELPSLFSERVLDMQPGDVAEPIASGRGLHVIQLVDRRGASMEVIEQTRARHILMKPNEIRSDAETEREITALHQQILAGADFAELARENSEDPGSGLKGGDLGWSESKAYVPAFSAMMDGMEVGEISPPFKSQFGWHVLEVQERRTQNMADETRKDQAVQFLHRQRFQDELQAWLKEIRDDAFVEMRLNESGSS